MGLSIQLILAVICGLIASAIAAKKGRNKVGWFFGGFFLGILGIIIVAVLSNIKERKAYREQAESERRRLREQLMQERMKSEAFRGHVAGRLDAHDEELGVSTRALGSGQVSPAHQLSDGAEQQALSLDSLTDSPNRQWYYALDGKTVGPVGEPQLKRMFRAGRLDATTYVWSEELGEWQSADHVSILRSQRGP